MVHLLNCKGVCEQAKKGRKQDRTENSNNVSNNKSKGTHFVEFTLRDGIKQTFSSPIVWPMTNPFHTQESPVKTVKSNSLSLASLPLIHGPPFLHFFFTVETVWLWIFNPRRKTPLPHSFFPFGLLRLWVVEKLERPTQKEVFVTITPYWCFVVRSWRREGLLRFLLFPVNLIFFILLIDTSHT